MLTTSGILSKELGENMEDLDSVLLEEKGKTLMLFNLLCVCSLLYVEFNIQ